MYQMQSTHIKKLRQKIYHIFTEEKIEKEIDKEK